MTEDAYRKRLIRERMEWFRENYTRAAKAIDSRPRLFSVPQDDPPTARNLSRGPVTYNEEPGHLLNVLLNFAVGTAIHADNTLFEYKHLNYATLIATVAATRMPATTTLNRPAHPTDSAYALHPGLLIALTQFGQRLQDRAAHDTNEVHQLRHQAQEPKFWSGTGTGQQSQLTVDATFFMAAVTITDELTCVEERNIWDLLDESDDFSTLPPELTAAREGRYPTEFNQHYETAFAYWLEELFAGSGEHALAAVLRLHAELYFE